MSEPDLRTRIKEMMVKNLMLQTTVEEIGDDLPLFGPDGLGLDSIDALELAVSMTAADFLTTTKVQDIGRWCRLSPSHPAR